MDFQIEEEPSVSTNTHCTRNKKGGCLKRLDSTWRFFHSAHFFVYLTHLISTWGDRMWHFAVSLFLVELNNNSLLLPAVFGLAVSSSLILFGALVGNWVDRNTRMKVVQVALLIQNLSVILCAVVLMLLFVYNAEITILWNGWMKIVCYTLVIVIGVIADLASTAMSIAIQRDWIIVVAGDSDKLSSMNATLRQIDLLSKLLSPLAVGHIMANTFSVAGCGFIAGWNLFSMCFEYLLLQKIYKMTPGLAKKGDNQKKEEEVSGLWSFDLTVTQLIQEMVYESKRGIVNGVQGSMNGIMDLLHFVMVIIIPAPEHFGILVILSVIFVSVGGLLFFCFARKTLGKDLFKCVCMKEKHSENGKDPKIVAESIL
ncbi:solute carrier family 40 member 1-like isoform X4 [Chiloscyllium plagiosum]|uniref:solute carrier family 40 member 1-like isoform X4 n=1 Tax=Chiloscyllium plagiosum TaxID=36176 RepID=UPI001CB85EB8|nr:solute carrier family 40 member 1-like isoform X4 [Chiloscyllium plagiosum]